MKRAEYKADTAIGKVRKLLGELPPEKLADTAACVQHIRESKIKTHSSVVYKARRDVLNAAPSTNGKSIDVQIVHRINIVLKTMEAVGGLANLKSTLQIIERIKGS